MTQDIHTPTLIAYQLFSYDIDLSAGDAVIDVTARIADNLSGVFDGSSPAWNAGASQCRWRSPSGQILWGGYFDDLSNGTPLDGEYNDRITLSRFSENGVWTLEGFEVVDEAGNFKSYNTQDLNSLGIRTTLNVTGGISDATAPTLITYKLSSYDIDLSAGDAVIDVSARIADNLSGVFDGSSPAWNAGASQCRWRSPSGQILWGGYFDDLSNGTPLDGEYNDRLTLSRLSENGIWTLEGFEVVDEAGNFKSYNTRDLDSIGIRTTLNVTGGIGDATAPTLISYELSSYDIDLSAGDAVIDVTARLADNISGVFDGSSPTWLAGASQCRWRSPSGQILWGGYFDDLSNGTSLDGEYKDQITLTKYAEKGTWTLEGFEVVDEAGNLKRYTTSEINALGIKTSFSVKGNWIQSSNTISLDTFVDNVELTGNKSINADGSSIGNIMLGNSSANSINGDGGNDRLLGGGGNDLLYGGTGDDYLYSGDGDDTVEGGDGNDEIIGGDGKGNDAYRGGTGADTVRYSSASLHRITINLAKGTASGSNIGTDKLEDIENIIGGSTHDTITGSSVANTIEGGTGADSMAGGGGDDTYVIDNPGDVVTESASAGTDTVHASINTILAANVENLTLSGTSTINGSGNNRNNTLVGNGANNILNGGTGADSMAGGGGDDTYIIDNPGDVVTEDISAGMDTIQSSITTTLTGNLENLTLTGTGAINGSGNDRNNALTGNAASNILNGGTGADTMTGGGGNDTYVVDNAGDVVTETTSAGTDIVQSSINTNLSANVENLNLTGTDAINGSGNDRNNALTGNAASNILNGGIGADTMTGGLGNDTYVIDSTGDVVTEAASAGTDTIESSINTNLAANVENLALIGTGTIKGTGNGLNNSLTGNSRNNTLDGGAGQDILTGLGGADIFRYTMLSHSLLSGYDRITDLSIGTDLIDGANSVSAANIRKLGTVSALTPSGISQLLNATASHFMARGASIFTFEAAGSIQTFLALNDSNAGFNISNDAIIEITGFTGNIDDLMLL
jgi:Ca2+-binding RTX toxin-like protein